MDHGAKTAGRNVNYEYRRRKSAEEMKYQVISFILMLFLTIVAFWAVYADLSKWFTIPVLLLLAAVQVAFQLFYFMHMSHKHHEGPKFFIFGGILVAFLTVLAFMTIIWW
ncbi:cytochrome c oxidase subunit 4B [Weizmannia acidilactici]|uniref:cytochrome c oxidase subunit IVB n=1 Tax=Weizmannia acidilactici TaxID=2607726 RepID=UPI00124F3290|nr:cytochrome c oxidase subunit IVB [Weizmannia acidilactici]GER68416.1 cytochrome c oxidase subunit 4B [Weizmannia acidilactici]